MYYGKNDPSAAEEKMKEEGGADHTQTGKCIKYRHARDVADQTFV